MSMPLTAIPRAPRSDAVRNRAAVIAAARKVMAKKGLDAGMDEIARAAGVGVGTVYRHFPTKDDLILGVIRARFERLAARAEAGSRTPTPGPVSRDTSLRRRAAGGGQGSRSASAIAPPGWTRW